MKKVIDIISEKLKQGFMAKGYEDKYGAVTLSNRPDLCQYQCNGAMAAAKQYKKAPIAIASEVVEVLKDDIIFKEITAIAPGFINITLSNDFLLEYVDKMSGDKTFGYELPEEKKTIVIDYGGANVAKPLHVGHLRSAIIGECVKRMLKFEGHNVIGDAHLGDWGRPIGLIITELKKRQPELVYFNDNYEGEYPSEAPFTIAELEEIYPYASEYAKNNPDYMEEAREAVVLLQKKTRGYYELWKQMMKVSLADLKKNYGNLNVDFDVWKGESDVADYIEDMVAYLKDNGYAHISEGALVVDVKEESDTKEIPPCMILKSDGAILYDTTDVATILEREKLFKPDEIIYLTDKRQELHFEIVFRCVKKTKIIRPEAKLTYIGFGTMNGKDGKPFKTRDGGVMRLENLLKEINEEVYRKIMANRDVSEEEAREISEIVGLAALKYGDMSNQATKDYNFDIERFTAFEGETGPYILYTMVRIKSILQKCADFIDVNSSLCNIGAGTGIERSESEKELLLALVKFNDMLEHSIRELAPHRLCQFVYELANGFNRFYHENKIIAEENIKLKGAWIGLLKTVLKIFELCIDILGFEAPERM